ncbi:MAG: putative 2-aminoethylphosphonate ABC transporter substrate-binding protein [Alphaproteobacteria bacterium]|nr:putative 2-aminoethylphosphonate ABC transporter substrate-binding protein [Alphaproteobacteria bacterium]
MKKNIFFSLLIGCLLFLSTFGYAQDTLVVYTVFDANQTKIYEDAFKQVHPNINLEWVRDSTGPITARLLAEKNNRQADVIWGIAATSLMVLKKQNMLEPYASPDSHNLKANFKDQDRIPSWIGMDAWASAICFNTKEAKKLNLSKPSSWQDLLKPEYKNHIVMPNPNSSGTGYLTVSAWIQTMGEQKAWAYMDDLHKNIGTYLHSGSKPCTETGRGEYPIGISYAYLGVMEKNKGAPLDIILPKEGLGWEMEGAAIMKGTKKLEMAKRLLDFAASKKANELYSHGYSVVAYPGIKPQIPGYPEGEEELLIKNDLLWAAENHDRIVEEWEKRYGQKNAPQ